MFNQLFKSGNIGNLELKNRTVVPPMLTQYANEDGSITERFIRYYEEKAKGDFGLIIVEDTAIERRGAGFMHLAGLWSDELAAKHKELTKRVQQHGAKIAVQLYHAGREGSSAVNGGEQIVAPSAIQDPTSPEVPHALTTEEVYEMIEKFAQAALRAKQVGYDAIELHGAHGYLINQFTSPFSNKRTDEFGGTFMNRLNFPLQIIKRTKELVGEEFPIIYRLSADELIDEGLTLDDTLMMVPILEAAGVHALHVSAGVYKSGQWPSAPTAAPNIPFVKYAKAVKNVVRQIPVIAVNKINTPFVAEYVLSEGYADFVAMGRASIADPALVKKAKEGRVDEIVTCIGCWQGCQGMIAKQKPVTCLVNPTVGKESESILTQAIDVKNVLVIGGGVAGMQAAVVAANRAHRVTLVEKTDQLGGQWLLAAIPPKKELLNTLTVSLKQQLRTSNVTVMLNTDATEAFITSFAPDHIIMATGATPIMPNISGVQAAPVVLANDILEGRVAMMDQVVVIGGGLVGAEVAEHLGAHNKSVSIVEMGPEIGAGMDAAPKTFLLENLAHLNVACHTQTKVVELTESSVVVETHGQRHVLPANQIVMAIGSRSNQTLVPFIEANYPHHIIGDALKVGRALEAIAQAYEVGSSI